MKKDRRVNQQQSVILFPDVFDDNHFNDRTFSVKGEWMFNPDFMEQIVFDFRSKTEQDLHKKLKTENTFKVNIDTWEERP